MREEEKMLITDEDFKNAAEKMEEVARPFVEYLENIIPTLPGNFLIPGSGQNSINNLIQEIKINANRMSDGWGIVTMRKTIRNQAQFEERKKQEERERKRIEYENSDKGRIEKLEHELAVLKGQNA